MQWSREITQAGASPVLYWTWASQATLEDQDRLTSRNVPSGALAAV
jgi:hypothetical protein